MYTEGECIERGRCIANNEGDRQTRGVGASYNEGLAYLGVCA